MKGLFLVLCVLAFAIAQVSAAEMPSVPPSPRTCELKTSYPTNPVDQYTFTWGRNDPSEGVTQYKLTYCKAGGSPTDVYVNDPGSGTTVSCDRFLDKGSVYYWRVCAYSPEGGWGSADDPPQEKYTVTNIPPAPRSLTVVSYNGNAQLDTYRFSWGRNSDPGVQKYKVRYTGSDGVAHYVEVNQPSSGNPYVDVQLKKAEQITWQVATCGYGGWSAYGKDTCDTGSTTSYTRPGNPVNVDFDNYWDNGFNGVWDHSPYDTRVSEVSYCIAYAEEGNPPPGYQYIYTNNDWYVCSSPVYQWSKILIKVREQFHGQYSDWVSQWLQQRAYSPTTPYFSGWERHFEGGTWVWYKVILLDDSSRVSSYHRWGYAMHNGESYCHLSWTDQGSYDRILIPYHKCYIDDYDIGWFKLCYRNDWDFYYPSSGYYPTYGVLSSWLPIGIPPEE